MESSNLSENACFLMLTPGCGKYIAIAVFTLCTITVCMFVWFMILGIVGEYPLFYARGNHFVTVLCLNLVVHCVL